MAVPFGSFFNLFRRDAPQPAGRRSFDAGGAGRQSRGMGTFGPINPEVGAALHVVRSRSRYLAANDPFASNGVANWCGALVGPGIRPAPKAETADLRALAGGAFESWADLADFAERTDWWGLQREIARHVIVDGEAVVILRDGPDGLRLQVLPPELLDESKSGTLSDGREIVQGVEFDSHGRRVAYWILPQKPSSIYAEYATAVRVDAADVLHIFQPLAAGQVRGVPWLAPAVLTASELGQLMTALLVGTKVSAMFAGFLIDMNQTSGFPFDGDQSGSILDSGLEPGTLKVLPAGMDVKFAAPDAAKEGAIVVRTNLLAYAAALGLPEHMLSGDLTNANYSSLRAGLLPFRARVEQVQYGTLAPQLLRPVWRRWLATEVIAGRLDVSSELRAEWIMPRHAQVDPAKDMAAVREALALGLMSRTQAIHEMGWNPDDLDSEIAADRAREAELGLSFGQKGEADGQ